MEGDNFACFAESPRSLRRFSTDRISFEISMGKDVRKKKRDECGQNFSDLPISNERY